MMRSIVLSGPFTDADFAELVAVVRRIDERHPGERFEVIAIDADGSLEHGARLLAKALPPAPDRTTAIWKVPDPT